MLDQGDIEKTTDNLPEEVQEKEIVLEPEGGYFMSQSEIINRQFDLTERAVRALEHIAAKDEERDKVMQSMQTTIQQNSEALKSNTGAFKVLQKAIETDGSYMKPIVRVMLYVFIILVFAVLLMAGVEQAIKLPISIPGF